MLFFWDLKICVLDGIHYLEFLTGHLNVFPVGLDLFLRL